MQEINIYTIFKLKNNFSLNDVKKSYKSKIDMIISNPNYESLDKEFLIETYKEYYLQALKVLKNRNQRKYISWVDNIFNDDDDDIFFNNALVQETATSIPIKFSDNKQKYIEEQNEHINLQKKLDHAEKKKIFSENVHREYIRQIDEQGNTIVYSSEENTINGEHNKKITTYKQYPDGHIENIDINSDELNRLKND